MLAGQTVTFNCQICQLPRSSSKTGLFAGRFWVTAEKLDRVSKFSRPQSRFSANVRNCTAASARRAALVANVEFYIWISDRRSQRIEWYIKNSWGKPRFCVIQVDRRLARYVLL